MITVEDADDVRIAMNARLSFQRLPLLNKVFFPSSQWVSSADPVSMTGIHFIIWEIDACLPLHQPSCRIHLNLR